MTQTVVPCTPTFGDEMLRSHSATPTPPPRKWPLPRPDTATTHVPTDDGTDRPSAEFFHEFLSSRTTPVASSAPSGYGRPGSASYGRARRRPDSAPLDRSAVRSPSASHAGPILTPVSASRCRSAIADALLRARAPVHGRVAEELIARGGPPSSTGLDDNKRREAYLLVFDVRHACIERDAANLLQRQWRFFCQRRRIMKLLVTVRSAAAVRVQAFCRRALACLSLRRQQRAALAVQCAYRMLRCMRCRVRLRHTLARIGRMVAAWRSRQRRSKEEQAAFTIQCRVRGRWVVRGHSWIWHRIVRIQRSFLKARVSRFEHVCSLTVRRAVALWRGCLARHLKARRKAARRCCEAVALRLSTQALVKRDRAASARLGAAWRGYAVRRRQALWRVQRVRRIQAVVRGMQERGWLRRWPLAARSIQAAWRSHHAGSCRLRVARAAAVTLQSHARRLHAMARLSALTAIAVLIQRIWRATCCRRKLALLASRAVQLQAVWRGASTRGHASDCVAAARRIQGLARGAALRRSARRRVAAVAAISAGWRMHAVLCRQRHFHLAAVRMARRWRGHRCRAILAEREAAAVRLQRGWSRHTGAMRRRVIMRVQAAMRASWARRRYTHLRKIARMVRRRHYARAQCPHIETLRASALLIQATWKGVKCRKALDVRDRKALLLQQAWWRTRQAPASRHEPGRRTEGTTLIHKSHRQHDVRLAATKIQALLRGVHVRHRLDAALNMRHRSI
eukprot:NODE_870_length_2724_cov_4.934155.p1 GENE.NODE_870_length_2724_cov_4.934155~~NODE_870_length_2724_cov_4.934155.p1  ORF type:complete len:781 (+),score=118.61 NODE_870_length_2724_cov_4.934155:132-2345(+)